jgi:hypothetical protein
VQNSISSWIALCFVCYEAQGSAIVRSNVVQNVKERMHAQNATAAAGLRRGCYVFMRTFGVIAV